MNRIAIHLLAAAIAIGCASCGHRADTDGELTDGERLEALDFRLEKHPDDHEALNERAAVLLNLGRVSEAVVDIDKAVYLQPQRLEYRMRQADVYFATGNADKSYRALSEAEKIAPDDKDVQLKMGEVMFYSRDYDRALVCLSKVTAQEPDNRTALFMKGFIYKELGDTANAVTLLNRVCDLYPDYEPAFEELGILYSTRNSPMAVEYLNTALSLEPSNTNAIYALAMYYQQNKLTDEAESLYRRLLDVNPNSTDAWHNMGYIEMMYRNDYGRAIDYFTRAVEADGSSVEALTNRGCAYELNNQRHLAKADYEAALAIDPGFGPALEGMKRLQ